LFVGSERGFRVVPRNRRGTRSTAVAVVALSALALFAASQARPSAVTVPKGCPSVRAHTGKSSGDWEVVFGRRKKTARAVALLRHVRGKGFRCAVIEREHRTHEVAIVGLHTERAALRIVVRAHKSGLRASVAQS
jgi:hypothetical protein